MAHVQFLNWNALHCPPTSLLQATMKAASIHALLLCKNKQYFHTLPAQAEPSGQPIILSKVQRKAPTLFELAILPPTPWPLVFRVSYLLTGRQIPISPTSLPHWWDAGKKEETLRGQLSLALKRSDSPSSIEVSCWVLSQQYNCLPPQYSQH